MRLFIVRHGDPDYERDDLTEAGHREARALAELFSREGLDEVRASPLGRARRTAGYTAEALGLPVIVEDWAEELSALLDRESGLMLWDFDPNILAGLDEAERGRLLWGGEWMRMPPFGRPDLAPALAQALERVASGADRFMESQGYLREAGAYRIASRNERRVALFCHNGSGLAMLAHFLRLPVPAVWSSFFLHTSSATTLLFEERRPGIATARCIGLSEISHLRAAGLPPGESGLKANRS
jgi:probable phosphoglycerate mutase